MAIQVIFFGPLERWAGKRQFFAEGNTIREIFEQLSQDIGRSLVEHLAIKETGEIKSHFHVLLNGIDTDSKNCLSISVNEGDVITIVPPIGGG
ncbi:MAG: MoaD/ThiS family protein [Candidatus Hodarchaeales archaeon]|jgi:molybdopterin converting factor small subunit